jgi:hypothetical protein
MAWLISWISAQRYGEIQSFQRIICDLLGRNCQKSRDKTYLSRVDIELINEQIKLLLCSGCSWNHFDEDTFTIIEYVPLGLNDKTSYYPLEKQTIHFHDNGYYKIEREILFKTRNSTKNAFHIYNSNIALLNKLGISLSERNTRI